MGEASSITYHGGGMGLFSRLGPMEILLILVVALLIFGPSKLPQLGKSVGESLREFKRSMKGEAEKDEDEKKDDK
jgi:sec-independent protein translocase protein TatA